MSETAPKTEIRDGKTIHFSVGAIVTNPDGEILLVDRLHPPPGIAGVAGHLDEGESPLEAIIREIREESGLEVNTPPELLLEEFVPWNYCGDGVTGHHWYVFKATAEGEPVAAPDESKSIKWYGQHLLPALNLEEVWRHWFEALDYMPVSQ